MWRNTWLLVLFSCISFYLSQLMADIIIKEKCPNGFSLKASLNDEQRIKEISFSDGSRICYKYYDNKLSRVTRYDSFENKLYDHTYNWNGTQLKSQTGWFTTKYVYDDSNDRIIAKSSPWSHELIEYDSSGNAIRIGNRNYSYDNIGQVTSEEGFFHATYDQSYNLIELNDRSIEVDEQNKVINHEYDLNGNLLKRNLTFGENNQISTSCGECYFYDVHGRLVQKGSTYYLYLGCEEIASFENGQCKTLKVPGIGGPIAIEIEGKPYAPVIDSTGIIRKLIDPITNSVYKENNCDIFGGGLTEDIPYAYRGKRYDPLTNLIYFGKRFYDPSLHRWVSPDPLGSVDDENLYQYVFNNPIKYCDPTGCSFWGYVLGLGEVIVGGAVMAGGMGLEVVTCGGFTFGFTVVEGSGLALIADGLARTTRESRDLRLPEWDKKYKSDSLWKEKTKKPPRFNGDGLGLDPSQCPGEGFEWRGNSPPESGKGNWFNPVTGEKLHPDLWHPDPKGPHWGYKDSDGISYDLFPDGSWQ